MQSQIKVATNINALLHVPNESSIKHWSNITCATLSLPTWNQKTSPIGNNLEKKIPTSLQDIWIQQLLCFTFVNLKFPWNYAMLYWNFLHFQHYSLSNLWKFSTTWFFFLFEFSNRVGYFRSGVLTCRWYIWKKLQVLDEIDTNQQISLTLKVYQICLTLESSNVCFYVMTLTLGF